ncbi:MAG: type II secretion system protein [Kiritimatiellae bacterium]|nr:type II secretion system protein [Kiritimatiellia bacterium]
MKKNNGFTVIELLVVTGIIAILMGMIGTSAFIARSQAYKAQARAETQQLITAVKAIWIAREDNKVPINTGTVKMTADNVKKFTVENDTGVRSYLEIPTSRLNEGGYLDPWGNEYEYTISDIKEEELPDEVFQISVSFLNADRFHYKKDIAIDIIEDEN